MFPLGNGWWKCYHTSGKYLSHHKICRDTRDCIQGPPQLSSGLRIFSLFGGILSFHGNYTCMVHFKMRSHINARGGRGLAYRR